MKKKVVVFSYLLFVFTCGKSQTTLNANSSIHEMIWGTGMTRGNGIKPGEVAKTSPLPQGEILGHEFLSADWSLGKIYPFDSDTLHELSFKYNLKSNEIWINHNNKVFAVEGSRIKKLIWTTFEGKQVTLLNSSLLLHSGPPLSGFYEVLDSGTFSLYKQTRIEIKKPTYNVALQTGSLDAEIIKKDILFYGLSGSPLRRISKKKDIAGLIEVKGVSEFFKENNLKVSNEQDMVLLFKYLNRKNNNQ